MQGQSSKITRFADRVFWRGHFVGVVSADAEQVDVSFLILDPSIPSHWLRFAPPERGSRLVCEKRRIEVQVAMSFSFSPSAHKNLS